MKWYPAKDQPAVESHGESSSRMIFGGRFMRSDFHGIAMGKPFTGMGIEGFDNLKKKFTMVWLDETATPMYAAEGAADSIGKVITYLGTHDDPLTGQLGLEVKYFGTWIDDSTHTFSIYEYPGSPEEYQSMEMVYTRK